MSCVGEERGRDVHFVGKGCHVWGGEGHYVMDVIYGRGWGGVGKGHCVGKLCVVEVGVG